MQRRRTGFSFFMARPASRPIAARAKQTH